MRGVDAGWKEPQEAGGLLAALRAGPITLRSSWGGGSRWSRGVGPQVCKCLPPLLRLRRKRAQLPILTPPRSELLTFCGTRRPSRRDAHGQLSDPGKPPVPLGFSFLICKVGTMQSLPCLGRQQGPLQGQAPTPWTCPWYLLNGLTHVQPHLHTVPGVRGQGHGQARHAVVAVAQNLDPHALVGLQGKGQASSASGRGSCRPATSPHPPGKPGSFPARGFLLGYQPPVAVPGPGERTGCGGAPGGMPSISGKNVLLWVAT